MVAQDERRDNMVKQVTTDRPIPNGVRPQNGAVHPQTTEVRPYRPTTTVVTPNTTEEHEIRSTWRTIWTAPFRAIREFYWLFDRDAKIRNQGMQVTGVVSKTRTESKTYEDSETGETRTVITHFVSYRFDAKGRGHTNEKKVRSLGNLKKDTPITVYYLPDTARPDSAIDWEPRRKVA